MEEGPVPGRRWRWRSPAEHKGLQRAADPPTAASTSQPQRCEAEEQERRSRGDAGRLLAAEQKKKQGIVRVLQAATLHALRGREAPRKRFPQPRAAGGLGVGLGAFYLLPGEKGKGVSRSCGASRTSPRPGGEEQVGCPEAQTSSKLLGAGWETLGRGGGGSAVPQPNQPPQTLSRDRSKPRSNRLTLPPAV